MEHCPHGLNFNKQSDAKEFPGMQISQEQESSGELTINNVLKVGLIGIKKGFSITAKFHEVLKKLHYKVLKRARKKVRTYLWKQY